MMYSHLEGALLNDGSRVACQVVCAEGLCPSGRDQVHVASSDVAEDLTQAGGCVLGQGRQPRWRKHLHSRNRAGLQRCLVLLQMISDMPQAEAFARAHGTTQKGINAVQSCQHHLWQYRQDASSNKDHDIPLFARKGQWFHQSGQSQ